MRCEQDYYETLGVRRERRRGRDPQGVPPACAQVSSRSESRRQGRRGALQEGPGSLRHPERAEEAADVRSVRLLFGERHAWRQAPGGEPAAARTWVSADSIFPIIHAQARGGVGRGAPAGAAGASGGLPGHLQPVVRPQRQARRSAGAAKRAPISNMRSNIDFWQAIKGTQVRLNISRQEACDTCHGTGARAAANAVCPECNGTGNVTQMAGAMRSA